MVSFATAQKISPTPPNTRFWPIERECLLRDENTQWRENHERCELCSLSPFNISGEKPREATIKSVYGEIRESERSSFCLVKYPMRSFLVLLSTLRVKEYFL